MFSKKWWKKTGERAAKTIAQTLIMMIGTDATGFRHLDWQFIATAAAVMALLSLASSILTTPAGPDPQDPSAV